MGLRLNGSTSGYVELNSPAVAGTTNLTIPLTGFGKVLQVVQGITQTQISSSSTTYTDTGLTATITPSSIYSKVLILVQHAGCLKSDGSALNAIYAKLVRGNTDISIFAAAAGYTGTVLRVDIGTLSCVYYDSPATTSATVYKTQFRNLGASSSVIMQNESTTSTITLIEVGP